jgi:uncharacterized protein YggE
MQKKSFICHLGFALVSAAFASSAQAAGEYAEVRTISVSGDAEIKVVPDEVVITLGIESRDKEILGVQKIHDKRVKGVLAALQKSGIALKDIKTDYITLAPEYDNSSPPNRVGYVQRTTIVVTLWKVNAFDSVLTSAVKAGVDYIHGISFLTTKLREHRDKARLLAVRAAREKATAMVAELGGTLGEPSSISEGYNNFWSDYGSAWSYGGWGGYNRGYQGMSQNVSQVAQGGASSSTGTMSPGMISIQANVSIIFRIK